MFDVPFRYLTIDGSINLFLSFFDFIDNFCASAHNIESCPCQQRRYGIQIGTVSLTADAGGFKRNTSTSAERVTDPRDMPKLTFAKLTHQFRNRFCRGSEVGIDFIPGFFGRPVDLFWAVAVIQLLIV